MVGQEIEVWLGGQALFDVCWGMGAVMNPGKRDESSSKRPDIVEGWMWDETHELGNTGLVPHRREKVRRAIDIEDIDKTDEGAQKGPHW